MACCKEQQQGKIPFRKLLRKIAIAIINPAVKEDHIMAKLEKYIQCEDSIKDRFDKKQPPSVEIYLYPDDKEQEQEGLSLLHWAISCNRDEVTKCLVQFAPNLCKMARTGRSFIGQTPFHIAVARTKLDVAEIMLKESSENKRELLCGKARGPALKGTKMTGELPLSIAVITCDKKMVELLLGEDADVMLGDSTGNTVLHTIVMYGYYFPNFRDVQASKPNFRDDRWEVTDSKPHFQPAFAFLEESIPDIFLRTLLHKRNDKLLTPIQLACERGLRDIFEYFVTMNDINRFNKPEWGVDDAFCYDVTELDTVRWREVIKEEEKHKYPEKNQNRRVNDDEQQLGEENCEECFKMCTKPMKFNKRMSALQLISNLPFKKGADFMGVDVVEEVVKKKWEYYKWWFIGFLLAHLIIIVILTYNTIAKTDTFGLKTLEFGNGLDTRFMIFNVLNIFVGLLYILQEIVRRFYFKQTWFPTLTHHNTICRLVFFLFGLTLLVDALWNLANANNYMRYFAIFFGWFGMIFFLRAIKLFSYHTVIFLEIICGDIVKFLPVVVIIFVPFIPAAYEAFGYKGEGFSKSSEGTLTLFQAMNGLGDIGNLTEAPKPGLSITVFILFIIFAHIIVLQTLIALMANNHIQNINMLYLRRVQRLSVIVFFESLLPSCWLKGVGEKVPFLNSNGDTVSRYHLAVNRIDDELWEETPIKGHTNEPPNTSRSETTKTNTSRVATFEVA